MDDFVNSHISGKKSLIRHIKMLELIGLRLYDNTKNSFLNRYGRLIVFLLSGSLMFLSQLAFLISCQTNNVNMTDFALAVPNTLFYLDYNIKLVVMIIKKDRIKELFAEIGQILKIEAQEYEKKIKIMTTWPRKINIFNETYFYLTCGALTLFLLGPLFKKIYNDLKGNDPVYLFALQQYYPFEMNSAWKYAIAYFFVTLSAALFHMCVHITCDIFVANLLYNVKILFSLIQHDLENLFNPRKYLETPDQTALKETMIMHSLKDIIKKHQITMRLSDALSEVFGLNMLFVVSLTSLKICFFGFLAVSFGGYEATVHLLTVMTLFCGIFYLAWPGQMLLDMSVEVGDAAYRSLWYTSNVKIQKIILTIITRFLLLLTLLTAIPSKDFHLLFHVHWSRRPCKLSALGFSDITLMTFFKIVTTTYSYLSLLRQMLQNQ